jgi:hypothetical protein
MHKGKKTYLSRKKNKKKKRKEKRKGSESV